MTRLPVPLLIACLALVSACGGPPTPTEPHARLDQGDGRVEWLGRLACADCEAIETRLVLERNGLSRRYDLVETFIAERDGARFMESGHWEMQGSLVRLDGRAGAPRAYALLPDGRLQPRSPEGATFASRPGDFLVPVDADAR